MTPRSLLETLQAFIERSYGMPGVIGDLSPFIVGDAGYLAFYVNESKPRPARRAHLLVRDSGAVLRAVLYYPDALVRHLERFNPLAGIGDENIDAFAVFVEELDHLLTVASRALERRPITLLELEHHANVTKYLVVLHFLGKQAGRRRVPEPLRIWARHHLFEKFSEAEGEEQARYRTAARVARGYVSYFESLPISERHRELRALQRRPFSETFRIAANQN
ncbi:MAG TPA: hypothetical protein VFT43_01725 [Candidatus Polarisedimenticolia bacterium]|nr:hypothetical protein [Candidatus Polarisedimenticolia bacterium]